MDYISELRATYKDTKLVDEFAKCIEDLLELEDVKQLENFSQHLNTSRLEHSISVAFYGFLMCKKLKLDYKSAARAGLLHDLFLYDWREEKQPEGHHAFAHPVIALRNAMQNTELNSVEQDAILNHMWPLSKSFPKHRVSYIVSLADKYCAIAEVTTQISNKILNKASRKTSKTQETYSFYARDFGSKA